jgi:hypothetical protein
MTPGVAWRAESRVEEMGRVGEACRGFEVVHAAHHSADAGKRYRSCAAEKQWCSALGLATRSKATDC